MGYESLENDSLITLKIIIENYRRSVKKYIEQSQSYKDATYELDRINSELNNR